MKRCRECGRPTAEGEDPQGDDRHSPAEELGDIFLQNTDADAEDICPRCKEDLGILSLLGFGE